MMFFDSGSGLAFGSMGWVDHGAIWSRDVVTGRERRIDIPDASYVSVARHRAGLMRVTAHGDTAVFSIRSCSAPDQDLCRLRSTDGHWRFEGDSVHWGDTPVALLATSARGRQEVLLVDGPAEEVRSLDLSWFNDQSYDLGYQGLVDCLVISDSGLVVVSVQRSSELVLVDPVRNAKTGVIRLADRGGNPNLWTLGGSRIVASDYDIVCTVDVRSGLQAASPVLQPPAGEMTRQFVGDYEVAGRWISVARPFSGDVVRLDLADGLRVVDRAVSVGQPLELCMISDETFLTRDWRTGAVGTGAFG